MSNCWKSRNYCTSKVRLSRIDSKIHKKESPLLQRGSSCSMIRAAVLKRYQKFWIKRSAKKDGEVESYEELSTLRLLCEELLNDNDRKLIDAIIMDDLMERIVDDDEKATHARLVAELQDKKSRFMVNSYLNDGSTPLHVVASKGFSDCVLAMILKGANPNAIHAQLGHSVLHVAAMSGSHKTLNCLLANGANRCFVNTQSGRMRTALHYAAERGSAPCLLLLLNPTQGNLIQRNEEMKAVRSILDIQDSFGNTALHLACVDGNEECVRMLIEAGASVTVRNAENKTAVDIARVMNAVNTTSNNTTTTSSSGVTIGAILFTVLMAAGLDPMTESATSDDARTEMAPEISLLDEPKPNPETNHIYVIITDGKLHSSMERPTYSGKVSKRLKFVRHSLYDSSSTENAEISNNHSTVPSVPNGIITSQNMKKVEVFKSREEAEQRIHTCFAVIYSPHKPTTPVPPAMQRTVWGNNTITTTNTVTTHNNSSNIPLVVDSMSYIDTCTIQSVSADSGVPANTYYTAHIDPTKIDTFLASVPHYYPDTNTSIINHTIKGSVEEEDPLWASYKQKHLKTKNVNKNIHTTMHDSNSAYYLNESNQTAKGAYFDTSLSNKPIKLTLLNPNKATADAKRTTGTPINITNNNNHNMPTTTATTTAPLLSTIQNGADNSANAATNAEAFELLCQMEELQSLSDKGKEINSDNAQDKSCNSIAAANIPLNATRDDTSDSVGEQVIVVASVPSISCPISTQAQDVNSILDINTTTPSLYLESPASPSALPKPPSATLGRFSPVAPTSDVISHANGSTTSAMYKSEYSESPMPASFVSPALRSPDLLFHNHYQHHSTDSVNLHSNSILAESIVEPMEGCVLNLSEVHNNHDSNETMYTPEDECAAVTSTFSTLIQESTDSIDGIETKATKRLSVSERVAAVERAITTSSSANSAVLIPVPPPIAAVMHKRGSLTRKTDSRTSSSSDSSVPAIDP